MIIMKILLPAYANLTELSRFERFFQEKRKELGQLFNWRTFLTANILIEQKSSFDNHFYLKQDERTSNGLIFV